MISSKNDWFDRHPVLSVVSVLLLFFGGFLLIHCMSTVYDHTISEQLAIDGYNVENITFDLLDEESTSEWGMSKSTLYVSSQPIEYAPGVFVDTWELTRGRIGQYLYVSSVSPYPMPASIVPVDIEMTITEEQYIQLQQVAGEQSVEDYIMSLIAGSITT